LALRAFHASSIEADPLSGSFIYVIKTDSAEEAAEPAAPAADSAA